MAGLFDDLRDSAQGTDSSSAGSGLFDDLRPAVEKPGVLGTLWEGTKSAGRAIESSVDTYTGNGASVVESAQAQQKAPKNEKLEKFYSDVETNVASKGEDPGLLDSIGAVGSAVIDNPAGAGLAVVEQLPNSVPTLAGGYAGLKAGAAVGGVVGGPVGAGFGGIIGGLAGMFLGNASIETGHKAMAAADDGDYTPEEMAQVKREGAVKGGVITAVDAATLGVGGKVAGAMQRTTATALETATRKALVDRGVDVADEAAVLAARQSPEISAAVRAAQDSAMKATDTLRRRAAEAGTLMSMETVGEGLGEYLGELAATGEGNIPDAVLESLLSVGQSGAETAWNMGRKREQAGQWEVAEPVTEPAAEQATPAAPEMVQPLASDANPNPAPVPRPDPASGPLSAAASMLPAAAPAADRQVPSEVGATVEPGTPAAQAAGVEQGTPMVDASTDAAGREAPLEAVPSAGAMPAMEPGEDATRPGEPAPAVPLAVEQPTEPPATPSQRAILKRRGVDDEQLATMTRKQAGELLRRQNGTGPENQARPPAAPQQLSLEAGQPTEASLRDELSYLERQARASGGWSPALTRERARIRTALEPFEQATLKPAETVDASQDTGTPGQAAPSAQTSLLQEPAAAQPQSAPADVASAAPVTEGSQQDVPASEPQAPEQQITQPSIEGKSIGDGWSEFAPESGTLRIPRAEMPQIRAEHRGAMVNFLNARGVQHQEEVVPAADLKPTQAEFSRDKVKQAAEYTGGNRSILVSRDGHVLDGHHQWMAAREKGEEVKVIRLDAPIRDLVQAAHEFPSSTTEQAAESAPAQEPSEKAPAGKQKKPRGVLAKKAEAEAKARGEYFAPGNIVAGYGGHDRVIAYSPPDAEGNWSVTVRAVQKQGDTWVDAPDQRERTHMTAPSSRELKAGPIERAEVAPGVDATEVTENEQVSQAERAATDYTARDSTQQFVSEPTATEYGYESDLFGNPIPTSSGKSRGARSARAGLRGNVQPATTVLGDTPTPAGQYHVSTVVGSEVSRRLGADRINSFADLAKATQYLYRSAVERFDGVVTDKDGRPLAVVGGFKGAIDSASVPLPTVLAEAVRVSGAANIWFSHNHPSGVSELSTADRRLFAALQDAFEGSGIEARGLIAVGNAEYSDNEYGSGPVPKAGRLVSVPAIEREQVGEPLQDQITSPNSAISIARAYYGRAGQPGMILLNAQHRVTGWAPFTPSMISGPLRHTGGLNAIYRSVSEGNAAAAILVHGGELDSLMVGAHDAGMNIAAALDKAGVRPLDVIDVKGKGSRAERGDAIVGHTIYSRSSYRQGQTGQGSRSVPLRLQLQRLTGGWQNAPKIKVVQSVANLPDAQRRQVERDGAFDVEGMFADGQVYLVADNLRDVKHAAFVLQHEVLGHAGLQGAYGRRLEPLLTSLYNEHAPLREQADALVQRFGYTPAVAMEEVLADMAADGTLREQTFWKRLVAAMRNVLRSIGMRVVWSDGDIQALLANARRYIVNGRRRPGARAAFSRDGRSGRGIELTDEQGRLLAPNGKPSKLSHRQWHQARSKNFKQWFGDWQAVATQERLDAMKPLRLKMPEAWQGMSEKQKLAAVEAALKGMVRDGEVLHHKELGDVKVGTRGVKKATSSAADPAKKVVLNRLREAFEHSIYANAQTDQGGRERLTYHKLVASIEVDGIPLAALFTVREDANGAFFYNTVTVARKDEAPVASPGELSSAQITTPAFTGASASAASPREMTLSDQRSTSAITEVASFVRQPLARVNPADVSKTIDRNGEPLVLYHGTGEEFTVFDQGRAGRSTGHSTASLGIFLTSDADLAQAYAVKASDGMPGLANVMPLFASIKRPYRMSVVESQGLDTVAKVVAMRQRLENEGYDGIQLGDTGTWVALYNTQVKSATNNTGAFDEVDPDIRYSRASQRNFIGRQAPFELTARNAKRHLQGRLADLKPAMLGALPLMYLRDFAPKTMTALSAYIDAKRAMDADRNELHTRYDAISQRWLKLRWTDRKAEQRLADLMHAATLAGVDPSKPAKEDYTPEQKAEYNRLSLMYRSLPEGHRAMFSEVRDAYKGQVEGLEQVIEENIRKSGDYAIKRAKRDRDADIQQARDELTGDELDEAIEDADKRYQRRVAAARAGNSSKLLLLRKKFESMRVDEPYFPLKRFGEYFVAMRDGTKLVSFSMFERAADMEAASEQLRKTYPGLDVSVGRQSNKQELAGAVDPTFVADLQELIAKLPSGDEVSEQMWQMYLETLPDYSMRKGFIHRKKTPGFDRDAMRAFASSMFHSSYQIARLKHSLEMNELVEQVEEQAKASADPVDAMTIANEMRKRHEWVMAPKGGKIAQHITSAAFVYQLGITPAAALVNMTQTWMMGIPVLGTRFGSEAKATAALTKASKDFVQGRGHLERRLEGKEAEAFAEFMRMGLIDKTQAHDLAGVGETGVEYNPVRHKVMGYISWAFHNAERYNREVTAMAAYRMARESGLEHAAAIKEAAELTWTTHFDYSSGNRARFMQSDTAKVLLVFRQHSVNMLSRLVIDLKDAMKGESAQVKNAAKRRLAGMFSMFGLFAGVMGIPGATAVLALLDLFDDDDDPWSAEDKMKRSLVEALGPDVAAAVLGGVPGTVMDLSLTERIGMGSLWFWSSNREMEGKDAYLYWMEQVLGAAPAMVANTFTGMSMIGEGHVFRGIETMMPKAIKDAMRSGRYAKEGVQTMSGDSLVDEVSTWNVIAQAMGFLPAHIAERYDTNSALRSAEQRIKTERRSILNRYAMAVRQGDGDSRQAMMARIQDFNRRYPQVAITGKTISLSLKARAQRDVRTVGGLALDSRLEFLREGM